MISWFVPLSTYPAGYGGNPTKPLALISLASQKAGRDGSELTIDT
jgi:hypothetical protein